jgi:ABC-type nickel/cobalt efflux system permease component RcnA
MNSLVAIQHWLYGGMASGLGDVAGGDAGAVFAAMAAAILFGAVHALMPGHGKTVLVSYHLGQPSRLRDGIANGAILTLTHVGLAVVLVLVGFAVISRAFAQGGRTPQFEVASGALVALIGAFLLWRSTRDEHHMHERDGRTLAFVTGMIPCPLTTFIMSYALAWASRSGTCGNGGHGAWNDRHHRWACVRCRFRPRPLLGPPRPN